MQVSFYCNEGDLHLNGGYGLASYNIITSLQKLGYQVPFNSSEAELQFFFSMPNFYSDFIRAHQHKIHLLVWESTTLPEHWLDPLSRVDEIWTASNWMKQIVEDNGFKVTNVYSHGLDPVWKPRKRNLESKIRFLHDGEPAVRKGGQLAFDAFKAAFNDKDDVELIIKSKGQSSIRQYDKYGSIIGIPQGNVKIITSTYELEQMVSLYHSSHVLVSPSFGEGFGFPALQGIGTGMPTIATKEWAQYEVYLGELGLDSDYIDSPWPMVHPGKVVRPRFDDLVDRYRFVYDNYQALSDYYFNQSYQVHVDYDWLKLTEKAFENVRDRLDPKQEVV